jgi:hypothetical protein
MMTAPTTETHNQPRALKISCTATDCGADLHCFKPAPKVALGACRECEVTPVDFERVHAREFADVDHTLQALDLELIRQHMSHVGIPAALRDRALRRGLDVLRARADHAVRKTLVKPRSQNAWDGRSVPFPWSKSVQLHHYAQHATATCCRVCAAYWHGIGEEDVITEEQFTYLSSLAWTWLERRAGPFE